MTFKEIGVKEVNNLVAMIRGLCKGEYNHSSLLALNMLYIASSLTQQFIVFERIFKDARGRYILNLSYNV